MAVNLLVALFGAAPAEGGAARRLPLPQGFALLTLILTAAAALWLAAGTPPLFGQSKIDYDTDDDGLIEVSNWAQFDAMRWDQDGNGDNTSVPYCQTCYHDGANPAFPNYMDFMGCLNNYCRGYELLEDITAPATTATRNFRTMPFWGTTLEGNGHSVTGLKLYQTRAIDPTYANGRAGLIGQLKSAGRVRNLRIINPDFTVAHSANGGVIAAESEAGSLISNVSVEGGSITAEHSGALAVGGLVGSSNGHIIASWSSAAVNTTGTRTWARVGGLAGRVQIVAATGATPTIIASYAAGAVSANATVRSWSGGIIGEYFTTTSRPVPITDVIIDSYCSADTGRTVVAQSGRFGTTQVNVGGSCQSVSAMQTPTDYTGIYAGWNVDITADGIPDNPWYFGTTSTYPTLSRWRTAGPTVDYDADDDGYIDVSNLHQLDALRYDSNGDGNPNSAAMTAAYELGFRDRATTTAGRMGCPTSGGCIGYELTGDLAIPAAGTPYTQWAPIAGFNSALLGRGHTISGLRVQVADDAGLFSALGASARVRGLGLINPSITLGATTTSKSVGALAGFLPAGAQVGAVYVSGGSVTVNNSSSYAGGLVGFARGAVRAAYSSAAVTAAGNTSTAGGLVGGLAGAGTIIASYAYGAVTSTAPGGTAGGLLGSESGTTAVVTDSYCDTTAGGLADCIGAQTGGTALVANGHATAALQAPTNYDGIYARWNIDVNLDANNYPDNPWWFGAASDYPRLRWQRPAGPPVDYDANDNNLIDVSNLDQLYAMRYDLDGDGAPDDAEQRADYALGYPDAATGTPPMGCAAACAGYELLASLTFPGTSSRHHPWAPIGGPFETVFDGGGNTLTGLNVEAAAGHAGLFAVLGGSGVIRDLGLVNPNVSVTVANNRRVGALAGQTAAGSRIDTSYVSGGRVTVGVDQADAGGMVGRNLGTIRASYATARVESTGTSSNLRLGGLVGRHRGGGLAAVYAAGAVAPSASSANVGAGGLVGLATSTAAFITAGYCDAGASGQDACIGIKYRQSLVIAPAVSAAALQAPTGYTGIYVQWNLDLDGDNLPDHPWNFGTSSQYPRPNNATQRAAVPAPPATDYDANNNNLIDISHVDQLNALRWDSDGDGDPDVATSTPLYDTVYPGRTATATGRMGCPATCIGYELTADLTYPAATGSGYIPYWTPVDAPYTAVFDGKGHTLTGINIYVPDWDDPGGLFGVLGASSTVRDLGIVNGALLSESRAVQSNGLLVGRLAGEANSVYAEGGSVTISTTGSAGGGLVGALQGTLRAAWSTATVTATGTAMNAELGGLVGGRVRGTLIAGFAAGVVTSTPGITVVAGGLIGSSTWPQGDIIDSYCDSEATGQSNCVGWFGLNAPSSTPPVAYTTAQLQAPTDYTGTIYANWNLDLDGDFFPDYLWNFGGASDYPRLNTPMQRIAAAPETTDYDVNDNGLIDIGSLAHLDAIRYDVNGDGIPEAATTTYNAAFSGRSGAALTRMGCPMGNCTGYELTMSLTFPAETSSPYTPWTPIAAYGGEFNGAGYTLSDLQIETGGSDTGLFGRLSGGGLIKDVGLLNPAVTSTAATGNTGALVGYILPTAHIDTSYVSGGSVSIAGASARAGGLAGLHRGRIRASYSTAAVGPSGAPANARIGGLAGYSWSGETLGSYAAGPVTASTGTGAEAGGLVGRSDGATDTITDSVCDTAATGQANCIGATVNSSAAAATGYATAALQNPTGYAGPYAHWNLDLDASGVPDYLWDFGTTGQYPTLHPPGDRAGLIPGPADYDANDNDLIDIGSIEQLNAIRWDLDGDGDPDASGVRPGYDTAFPGRTTSSTNRMGCPNTCAGYELRQDLNFDSDGSGGVDASDAFGGNFTPIGGAYASVFEGNGYALRNLTIDQSGVTRTGLFVQLNGSIRNLGLIDPDISGGGVWQANVGAMVARNQGVITSSYVLGGTVNATGTGTLAPRMGGLTGYTGYGGDSLGTGGAIRASYSTAALTTAAGNAFIGGLTGNLTGGTITASYAAAPGITDGGTSPIVGGLVGRIVNANARITNSYCDITRRSGNCVGGRYQSAPVNLTQAPGQTTAQLQTPTGYAGPYVHWNLDLDNSGRPDYLWNFGTASQYPTLHPPTARPSLPPLTDYDTNDNDLIDIDNLAQLNAIRWDQDGDGAPDSSAVRPGYDTAFPGRTTSSTNRMGCPNTCAGYELTMSLTFPAATSSAYNPWTPLAAYAAEFNGNGHTLTDLNVSVASGHAGLFQSLNSGARVRNVGLIDPEVTSRGVNVQSGALAGRANAGSSIETSYVQGGEIAVGRHAQDVGGLVGYLEGAIRASYATGVVLRTADPCTNCNNIDLGGLVGHLYGNGSIAASYAAATSGNIVSAQSWVGGLVSNGVAVGGFTPQYPTITDSYCDTTAGPDRCVNRTDGVTLTVDGQTTAALQNPTGYEGPYVHWNLDLDASGRPDYLWNFGTTGQYPTLHPPTARPALPPLMDYDTNDNDLIDIDNLAQLNAIRWDLDGDGAPDAAGTRPGYDTAFPGRTTTTTGRMGCPNTCAGYELTMSLTFPAATSSSYNPWTPIDEYAGDFDGRGHTLTNMNVATEDYAGLFGRLNSGGLIRDVGMINPIVTLQGDGTRGVGGLVGTVRSGGQIDTSYVAGGRITLTGGSNRGGGLVGQSAGLIRASYASAEVRTDTARNAVAIGGLVGRLSGQLVASYASGAVSASGTNINVGGLVGRSTGANSAITDSYCDTAATMQTACVGPQSGNAVSATGYLTAALQSPTDYAGGIYVNWNLDLDGNYAPDYPWRFGTSSDYPMLNTPMQRTDAAPPPVDYDRNDNGLIDIRTIAQLHAIRWDANGDGVPESNPAIYSTIFEGRITATSTRMGCPAGNCTGYELAMSLSFPSETTSPYNPWTPIAAYEATFDGAGYTLSGLRISTASGDTGLIGSLNSGGLIRDLGLLNPAVTSTANIVNTGALVGRVNTGANIDTSYVAGGRVAASGVNPAVGGLVGRNEGRIRAAYSTAAIANPGNPASPRIGGLVGSSLAGEIVASYAAGLVTPSTDGGTDAGGLLGRSDGATDTITDSVCDTTATGQTACVGFTTNSSMAAAAGYTTTQMRQPTGYHFPYINWNLDLNGDGVLDYPWNFGAANQYPALHTPEQRARLAPEPTDYDLDDDNLIDISSIEQLNAIRWDLNNGDGDPETANSNAYGTAFPGRTTSTPGRMGCLDTCAGYELVANLTFPAETSSPYNPWTPIGGFLDTVLDGKGHSLTDLRVEFDGFAGLFHQIGGSGAVRNLGLVNPNVTSTANGRGAGALAGHADNGSVVEYVYVHGGRIATTGGGGGSTAWVGGLIGDAHGTVRASYAGAAIAATQTESVRMGGLVGGLDGAVIDSFAYGPVLSTATQNSRGGLIGSATASGQVAHSYCDLTTGLQAACIGPSSPSFSGAAEGKTTEELQTPTGYDDSIYQNWNQDLDNDPLTDDPVWDFGGRDQYPALWFERRTAPDSPPPGGPRQAQPPQDTPYNPAADHPEIYENDRHEMAATCDVQYNADNQPVSSTITFDLGNYRGQVILHLAQWNGEYFTSYESLGIAMPTFQRNGQTATIRITTNPTQTRFLLDSISPTTNLVLGYADCHTDDHTGVLATPGAAASTETAETSETATTSTPADAAAPAETAETSTPAAPKIYVNDRYEMTASCAVQHNADNEPETSQITFNLGNYQATVLLSISLWNGEYYASLESHSLPEPTLARDGQTATVQITTNPTETRFLLDGTPNGLRTNLLLGYADCHTAGE